MEENTDMCIWLKLENIAIMMHCFANDLLYIHHHACGDSFDTIHSVTADLYEKAIKDVDNLCEMSIRVNEDIPPLSLSLDILAEQGLEWPVIIDKSITYLKFVDMLQCNGELILDALRSVEPNLYSKDVYNKIDEVLDFWSTEILYKNIARQTH